MQVHIQNDGPVTIELESPIASEVKVKPNEEISQLKSKENDTNGISS